MSTHNAQEYLIRALVYSGSYGLFDRFDGGSICGAEIADFLTRAVSMEKLKKQSYILHGVHTVTWWRMLTRAYLKLGDLDELKLKELLEASGWWHWGNKPANEKQIFNTHNISKIYDKELAENGWRLVSNQMHLRTVVDRVNAQK